MRLFGFPGSRGILAWMAAAAMLLPGSVRAQCSYRNVPLRELKDFGDNPGHLKAFYYLPEGIGKNAPLVVALHGCAQQACDYDDETGWTDLAREWKFAVLFPEQQLTGNPLRCWNWWQDESQVRGHGEPASIFNMVRKMGRQFPQLDLRRLYVTGLSAGGGMTALLLASYPDCFRGGAPVAGVPYKCAQGIPGRALGQECMGLVQSDVPEPTASAWGDFVRHAVSPAAPGWDSDQRYSGPWPLVSIWQGADDHTVSPVNLTRLMLQWTDVHEIDPLCFEKTEISAGGYTTERTSYPDAAHAVVETYLVGSTGHATPVYPELKCGCVTVDCACEKHDGCTPSPGRQIYMQDAHICSSRLIGHFWGLDRPDADPAAPRCKPLQ